MANKLYPLPSISQQIEDFAKEMLFSAANADHTVDTTNADGSNAEILKVLFCCNDAKLTPCFFMVLGELLFLALI